MTSSTEMNFFSLHSSQKSLESHFNAFLNQSTLENYLTTLVFWAILLISFAANNDFHAEIIVAMGFFGLILALTILLYFTNQRKIYSHYLGLGLSLGLSACILYTIAMHFQDTGDFAEEFKDFVQGWSFACIELMLANQGTRLQYKIATLLLSFGLRFGVLGGFDPKIFTGGIMIRNILYEVFLIYIFYTFEKKQRSLFDKADATQQELTQLKSIIEQISSPNISIFDSKKQKTLFCNKAFYHLANRLSDEKENPTYSSQFINFQKSLKIDKNSTKCHSNTLTSMIALDGIISLYDFILKFQNSSSPSSQPCYLSGSCEIKGDQHIFDITITPVTWESTPAMMIALENVTYKKEIADLKLAQKNKDLLIATVSHELRTPLHGILGLIQIVEPKVHQSDVLEYLSLCKDNAHLLLNLVNSLLDHQQIQYGEIKLNPAKVHLQTLIKSVFSLFTFLANQKNIQLSALIEGDIPSSIITDENRLKQILINLVSNALKFTSSGEITIRVGQNKENSDHLKFSVSDTGRGIKKGDFNKLFKMYMKIEDKEGFNKQGVGLGLSIANNISKILCSQAQNNGIHVQSEYGSGSTFSFLVHKDLNDLLFLERQTSKKSMKIIKGSSGKEQLPTQYTSNENFKDFEEFPDQMDLKSRLNLYTSALNPSSPKAVSPTKIPSPSFHRKEFFPEDELSGLSPQSQETEFQCNQASVNFLKTSKSGPQVENAKGIILVVDDNYFNLLIARNTLENLGYQVQTALSGQEAIERFQRSLYNKTPYTCILMDCQMPIMDGFETTQLLRKMMEAEKAKQVPVIALTASHDRKTIDKCYASGMSECLCKPLIKEDLFKVLSEI